MYVSNVYVCMYVMSICIVYMYVCMYCDTGRRVVFTIAEIILRRIENACLMAAVQRRPITITL